MRLPWSKRRVASIDSEWARSLDWTSWEAPRNYIAGEASYTAALRALTGPPCDDGYCLPVVVTLVREPRNPYDANAFRAEVDGRLVGYLRRHIAAQLAPPLDRARCRRLAVPGLLRGGSTRAPNVGCHVWLGRCLSPGGLELPPLADDDPTWRVSWPLHELELSRLSDRGAAL